MSLCNHLALRIERKERESAALSLLVVLSNGGAAGLRASTKRAHRSFCKEQERARDVIAAAGKILAGRRRRRRRGREARGRSQRALL